MARVKDVKLEIGPPNGHNTRRVTVSFKLGFNEADHHKKFLYAINLRPSEIPHPPDKEIPSPPILYRFKFGKSLTKTASGGPIVFAGTYTFTRNVPKSTINEDPGFHQSGQSSLAVNRDEIYASVLLMVESSDYPDGFIGLVDEKRSAVKTLQLI